MNSTDQMDARLKRCRLVYCARVLKIVEIDLICLLRMELLDL
jgi:hypothetical protein